MTDRRGSDRLTQQAREEHADRSQIHLGFAIMIGPSLGRKDVPSASAKKLAGLQQLLDRLLGTDLVLF